MRRHLALLLSLLICAEPALADQTINQLSPATALGGNEWIPMFQGANPAVKTTPRSIATYVPTQFNAIDATQSSGADMCAKIAAAAATLAASSPGGGTIDARGFKGTQTCAESMFASWPAGTGDFAATVLLGTVNIQSSVQQAIPTHTTLRGLGFGEIALGGGVAGSSIQACDSSCPGGAFPGNTALILLGATRNSFFTQLINMEVACVTPSVTIPTGSIGVENLYSQESTHVDHIDIKGCYTGLLLGATASDGQSYTHITIDPTGVTSSNFVCIQIGSPSAGASPSTMAEIDYVSCGDAGAGSAVANMILLDGGNYSLRHIYLENNVSSSGNFVNIGSQGNPGGIGTGNIILENIYCAGTAGMADCIHITTLYQSVILHMI